HPKLAPTVVQDACDKIAGQGTFNARLMFEVLKAVIVPVPIRQPPAVGPNPQGTIFTLRERENEIFGTGLSIGSIVPDQSKFLCMGIDDIDTSPQGTNPLTVSLI